MTTRRRTPLRSRRATPALTLVFLAPFVGEVLNGATRLSYIAVFIPQLLVWGCGALLIRETTRRWGGGWPTTVALGAALAIAVEFLILQTSVAPIPWLAMAEIPAYDRVWGINWLWFAYMLGYEIVWVVLVPIALTELVFPERRTEPWLTGRGYAAAAAVFTLGSVGLWALWTRLAVPQGFGQPVYDPPAWTLAAGALGTALAVGAAWTLRTLSHGARHGHAAASGRLAPPWILALLVTVLALPWWALIVLVFVPRPLPLAPILVAAAVWAAAAIWLLPRGSRAPGWSDRHRYALAASAVVVTMAAGFLGSQLWPAVDLIGKIVLNVVATLWLLRLGFAVWRRTAEPTPHAPAGERRSTPDSAGRVPAP